MKNISKINVRLQDFASRSDMGKLRTLVIPLQWRFGRRQYWTNIWRSFDHHSRMWFPNFGKSSTQIHIPHSTFDILLEPTVSQSNVFFFFCLFSIQNRKMSRVSKQNMLKIRVQCNKVNIKAYFLYARNQLKWTKMNIKMVMIHMQMEMDAIEWDQHGSPSFMFSSNQMTTILWWSFIVWTSHSQNTDEMFASLLREFFVISS